MSDPGHLRKLYEQSEAESWGLGFEDFVEVLRDDPLHLKDLALAQACSRGIPAAWERFSARYREPLYAAALAIARNDTIARELADSIYGEIFLSRPSKLATYSGRGPLEGWLKAVLSRAYIDRYRSQRRVVSLDDRLAAIHATVFNESPSDVDPRLSEAIEEAFLSLPAEQRYLLASYFFDQRTLSEIARTLDVHESTVSRRLDRLIKLLRGRIARNLREKGMTASEVQESFSTDVRDLSLGVRCHI